MGKPQQLTTESEQHPKGKWQKRLIRYPVKVMMTAISHDLYCNNKSRNWAKNEEDDKEEIH